MTERPTFLKRQLLTATALTALAVPLLAPAAKAQDIKRGGTLIMAREQEPQTLDPFVPNDNGSIFAIEMICDSLVEPDDTGYGLRPALAESWTTAEDGLSWTFTLRDAKFSDGTPVTIDDVVFSLNTLRQPERPMGFLLAPVKDVVAVDAKTLRIDLNTPYAPLPAALSAFAAAIVSKAAYEANPEAFGSAPVCAGPFKVDAFERGSLLAVSANPNYWDMGADGQPKPYLAGVEFRYVPETNSRVLGLQNGDLDLVSNVGFNNAKALMANSDLVVAPADVFKLEYVYLNHTKKPWTQGLPARPELCRRP
ncbi:MAG: ABC transporter substrate-binding protein [Rhodobacteraceae bacterium]|nr:ABC transporter substrate-binding protein [Paracoccaceae bacterium]